MREGGKKEVRGEEKGGKIRVERKETEGVRKRGKGKEVKLEGRWKGGGE